MEESAERKSGVFVVGFPVSLRSDLAYCRNALKDYIKVHQLCTMVLIQQKWRKESLELVLSSLEQEIKDIFMDQRKIVEELKRHLRKAYGEEQTNPDNGFYNRIIKSYLDVYLAKMDETVPQKPNIIKPRLSFDQLIYSLNLRSVLDAFLTLTPSRPPQPVQKPKPVEEIKTNAEEKSAETPSVNTVRVNLSRDKLREALQKAKTTGDQQLKTGTIPKFVDSDSEDELQLKAMVMKTLYQPINMKYHLPKTPEKKTVLPRGRRPKILQEITNEPIMPFVELPEEPKESNDHTKESFLKLFGLFSKDHIKSTQGKRKERRRRNVQSTEKVDFHYGNVSIPLYEKWHTSKRKRENYLSPPAKDYLTAKPIERAKRTSPLKTN